MTRPRKQTVEWFPHSANHGRTMFTLEKRYGIAGYGFWFKLLEVLANTEGHFIDADDPATLEFISAYTYTDKDTCIEILNLLATLDAIDPELWGCRLIWSDNFVQGLLPLYRKRDCDTPTKPDKGNRKPQTLGQIEPDNRRGRRGRRVEEGEETPPVPPEPPVTSPPLSLKPIFFRCPYFEVDLDYRLKLAKEYPALNDDLLIREFSKAEDYIADHPTKYTFKANGHLANPKGFLRRWLDRVQVDGKKLFEAKGDKPKGLAAVQRFMAKGEKSAE